jgi:hypothetical protein
MEGREKELVLGVKIYLFTIFPASPNENQLFLPVSRF